MPVQDVVQTVTRMLGGRLTPRETVTILSTMTRDALPDARRLRTEDPGRAHDFARLLATIEDELRDRERTSDEPAHLVAVADDLARLRDALGGG